MRFFKLKVRILRFIIDLFYRGGIITLGDYIYHHEKVKFIEMLERNR